MSKVTELPELLTVEELANALKVPKSWVYAQTRKKESDSIPMFKAGKYCRFVEAEVREWLRRKQG